MKAILSPIPPDVLYWHKKSGADRWDEMWEGVLHMGAMPNREHQDLQWAVETFLRLRWAEPRGYKVHHDVNLASPKGWPNNYRIPDLVLLLPERFGIDRNEYFEGAPSVVVEIQSPDDESEEKLPFYASLGVPEVWMIHRDTKEPRVLVLRGGLYEKRPAGPGGWVLSEETGIELRQAKAGKLQMRLKGDDSSLQEMP